MRRLLKWTLVALLFAGGTVLAQPLSQQVLQLLDRVNTWTALNTFDDLTITGTCIGCGGGGGGTVTSVAMTVAPAAIFDIAGTPIVGAGTLALTMDTQADNLVLAGPDGGGPLAPTFRALVDADIPNILTLTGSSLLWSELDFTVSSLADVTTVSAADITSGALALARLTDGAVVGVPLIAGGGGGDPTYAALNLASATAITGQLAAVNFPALTGDITTVGGGLLTDLSATGIVAAVYGSATQIPQITFDDEGRATLAVDVPIGTVNLLDGARHADTAVDTATRGSVITGNAGNLWDELIVASGLLSGDGIDIVYTTSGALITTGIDADAITVDEVILARGGTNASLVASHGAVFYSTATAGALTAVGVLGECFVSQGAAAPIWDACATLAAHALLSATHSDTVAGAPVRGDLIIGTAAPAWDALTLGAVGTMVRSNGSDVTWSTDASLLTALNASALASGIVAVPRGGTGLATYTIGDLLAASGATTLSRIAAPAVGQMLASAGVGVLPAWSASPTLANLTVTDSVRESVTSGITASTTQAQGNGPLTTTVNEVSDVANPLDVVTLRTAVTGDLQEVINNGGNTLQIFPFLGDDLGQGANLSTTLGVGETVVFRAFDATTWNVESTTEIAHAEMFDFDNGDAYVINDAGGDEQVYHTNGLAAGDLRGWTFDAGGAGTSFPIAAIANGAAPGVDIEVTTTGSNGLAAGDIVSQSNLADPAYVGIFVVKAIISVTQYEVAAVFTATGTGTMDQAATLIAATGSAGEYLISWAASAAGANNNDIFDFSIHVEAAHQTTTNARQEFETTGNVSVISGVSIITIAAGDHVSFDLENVTPAANGITIRNFTLVLVRL